MRREHGLLVIEDVDEEKFNNWYEGFQGVVLAKSRLMGITIEEIIFNEETGENTSIWFERYKMKSNLKKKDIFTTLKNK